MNRIWIGIGGIVLGGLLTFGIIEMTSTDDAEFIRQNQILSDSLKTLNTKMSDLETEGNVLQFKLIKMTERIDSLKIGLHATRSAHIEIPPQDELEAYLDSVLTISGGTN